MHHVGLAKESEASIKMDTNCLVTDIAYVADARCKREIRGTRLVHHAFTSPSVHFRLRLFSYGHDILGEIYMAHVFSQSAHVYFKPIGKISKGVARR